jgi:DNA-directed RNA polymerase specialized sigma24 family protein
VDSLSRLDWDFQARGPEGFAVPLRRWKARHKGLRTFRDPGELIEFLGDRAPGLSAARDAALAALCLEARDGDEDAALLLLWLLLPALAGARRKLGRWEALEPDDLDAELLAGLWQAAKEIRTDTRDVAGRLLNRASWRALGAMREAIDWSRRALPLSPSVADREPEEPPDRTQGILNAALLEGVISQQEAVLVLATRTTIRRVSARLGITVIAAQQRRHRARERLLAWLADSSQIPRTSFLADSSHEKSPTSHENPVKVRPPRPSL